MSIDVAKMLPAYQVQPLSGFVERTARKYVLDEDLSTPEKKRYVMQDFKIKEPAGFLVFFPKGHSIRVSAEELKRLGFGQAAPLVDMATGETLERPQMDLAQMVQQKAGMVTVKTVDEEDDD